jgi:hypothetical protein
MQALTCPVCGYPDLDEPAYYENGAGSDDICPSCGFQFGYSDDSFGINDPETQTFHKQWREKWIAGGMKFKHPPSSGDKLLNWDPVRQLLNIGIIVKK